MIDTYTPETHTSATNRGSELSSFTRIPSTPLPYCPRDETCLES